MKKSNLLLSSLLTAATFGFIGCGDDTKSDCDVKSEYKVALWGDQFYYSDPVVKETMKTNMTNSVNKRNVEFTLFAGDTKSGSTECTDQAIGQDVADVFNRFDAPTIYSLGDNEWTDCHRTNNGSYDPLERLTFLRKTFFTTTMSQGKNPIELERQGALGEAYSENSRFTKNSITFVSLHVVGSDNNQIVDTQSCVDKTNSERNAADCTAADAEYQARTVKNVEWVKSSFAKAKEQGSKAVMLLIQANPKFEALDETNGFNNFINVLRDETEAFDGKVVLVHGDSHTFQINRPLKNKDGDLLDNFLRVEVYGSSVSDWVEVTIDLDSPDIFSFELVAVSK